MSPTPPSPSPLTFKPHWNQCLFSYNTTATDIKTHNECEGGAVSDEYRKAFRPKWKNGKCHLKLPMCRFDAPEGKNLYQLRYAPSGGTQANSIMKISYMCDRQELERPLPHCDLSACIDVFKTPNLFNPCAFQDTKGATHLLAPNEKHPTNPLVTVLGSTFSPDAKPCSFQILDGIGGSLLHAANPYP